MKTINILEISGKLLQCPKKISGGLEKITPGKGIT